MSEAHPLVQQLVKLRKAAGLTQVDVAAAMGRTQSVVSDIETGTNEPRLSTLVRYARAVGAEVNVSLVYDFESS